MLKVLQHSVFFCKVWYLLLLHSTMWWFTRCCNSICCQSNPILFSISAQGSFTCITQNNAFTSLRGMKQWLSVLLKDKSDNQDSNLHSADQKHKSLSPVLFSPPPQGIREVHYWILQQTVPVHHLAYLNIRDLWPVSMISFICVLYRLNHMALRFSPKMNFLISSDQDQERNHQQSR